MGWMQGKVIVIRSIQVTIWAESATAHTDAS